eukprot:scaffold1447_cov165-Ochromonas_danica.AAC.13
MSTSSIISWRIGNSSHLAMALKDGKLVLFKQSHSHPPDRTQGTSKKVAVPHSLTHSLSLTHPHIKISFYMTAFASLRILRANKAFIQSQSWLLGRWLLPITMITLTPAAKKRLLRMEPIPPASTDAVYEGGDSSRVISLSAEK